MEDGYPPRMDQGWFRVRATALTSAGLAVLAVAARTTFTLGRPEKPAEPWRVVQPELFGGLPVGVLITALVVLVATALLGATIGALAIGRRQGRVLGAVSGVVCLGALFVWW